MHLAKFLNSHRSASRIFLPAQPRSALADLGIQIVQSRVNPRLVRPAFAPAELRLASRLVRRLPAEAWRRRASIIVPVICGAGYAGFHFAPLTNERAERREAHSTNQRLSASHPITLGASPLDASLRRLCASEPYFRGRTGPLGPLIPAASAAVHPSLVQPLKAAPRSWSGRLPEASRTCGYEPRAQAPHPVPLA